MQQCGISQGVEHRHEWYRAARQRGGERVHEVRLVRKAFNFEMLPVPPRAGVQSGVHEEAVQGPQESVREAHEKAVHHESRVEFVRSGGAGLRGGSKDLLRGGHLAIDGSLPCNTGGGLVGFGHPVGATGVKQLLEIFRQMKGLCENYQMPTTPEIGVAANMGGDDKTVVSLALRNCT